MEAVVTATAHIDDSAGSPAVSAEMTVAEAPTSKTSAAVVPTAEAPAAKVATADTTARHAARTGARFIGGPEIRRVTVDRQPNRNGC